MNKLGGVSQRPISQFVFACLVGLILFLIIVGPQVLSPGNIAWLKAGDSPQHYLGWAFFRSSDWTLPLGLNPNYGLDLSSTIVFSDSIPLLAVLFKAINPVLPETFQYFGIWLLICFVAQAYFGFKIVSLISNSLAVSLIGAALLVISPPMLGRMTSDISNTAHLSLTGHFLILAALYGFLRPAEDRTTRFWVILLATTIGIHAYFVVMVAAFWSTDLLRAIIFKRITLKRGIAEVVIAMGSVIGLAWLYGYFHSTSLRAPGFGIFASNLLTFFDASGWSYFWPDLAEGGGNYEGFAFLGTGVVALYLASLLAQLRAPSDFPAFTNWQKFVWLPVVALGLFAISNNITVFDRSIFIPMPEKILDLTSIFRSSGRMIWPVFYLTIIAVIFMVTRSYKGQTAILILSAGLLLQIADTSAGWLQFQKTFKVEPSSNWKDNLDEPFWAEAAKKYASVRTIMPEVFPRSWKAPALYAARNNMKTDFVYIARVNQQVLQSLVDSKATMVKNGDYDPDTLYIIDEKWIEAVRNSLNQDLDGMGKVDGYYILAPGWKKCADCTSPLVF